MILIRDNDPIYNKVSEYVKECREAYADYDKLVNDMAACAEKVLKDFDLSNYGSKHYAVICYKELAIKHALETLYNKYKKNE